MHLVRTILTRSSRHTVRLLNMIIQHLKIRLTILRHITRHLNRTKRLHTIRRARHSITVLRVLNLITINFLSKTQYLLTMIQLCNNQLSITRTSSVRGRRRKRRRNSRRSNSSSTRRHLLATTGMLFTHNTLIIDLNRLQVPFRRAGYRRLCYRTIVYIVQ